MPVNRGFYQSLLLPFLSVDAHQPYALQAQGGKQVLLRFFLAHAILLMAFSLLKQLLLLFPAGLIGLYLF